MMLNTTLCYIERGDAYFMLHRVKKEHDVNRDKWVGVGGKFEDGESPEECLLRETFEETGLTLTEYRYRGIVTFVSDRWPPELMHLFTASGWTGTPHPCDEANCNGFGNKTCYPCRCGRGTRCFCGSWRRTRRFSP